MGFSLSEIGYPIPINTQMAEDLLLLESYIAEKQKKDMDRVKK